MIDKSVLEVHSLSSGSSGNSFLVKSGKTSVLIDAGIGMRKLCGMMSLRGVSSETLSGIFMTHEHTDHSIGAGPLSRKTKAPIIANAATLQALAYRDDLPFPTRELPTGDCLSFGNLSVRSFRVPHDAVETVGYIVESEGVRIALMTDSGSATPEMREALKGVNLAIVEANHDLDWLWRGPYTQDMKERVASPTGHLSNDDCADLLAETLEANGLMTIWLAHLSRVNNSVSLARKTVQKRIKEQTKVPFLLEVALRDEPSVSWKSGTRAVQLALL